MQYDLFGDLIQDASEPPEPAAPAPASPPPSTMADVAVWCRQKGKERNARAIQRMGRAAFNTDPRDIPTTEAALAKFMPASDDTPYPGEYKNARLYHEQRRLVQAALRGAIGYYAEKQALRARKDAWADLLAAIKPFTEDGGLVAPNSHVAINALADACRKIEMTPHDLGSMDRILDLDATAFDGNQRDTWRRAIMHLQNLGQIIPGLKLLLHAEIIGLSFARRTKNAAPRSSREGHRRLRREGVA